MGTLLQAIVATLRGQTPELARPRTFVAVCGAAAWLALLWLALAEGLLTWPSVATELGARMRASHLRHFAQIICIGPFLAPIGSAIALLYRSAGAQLVRLLARCSLEQALEITTRRSAPLVLLAVPLLGLVLAPPLFLWEEFRRLREHAGASIGRALFVQISGRLIAIALVAGTCALAVGCIYVVGEVGKHILVAAYVCGVRLLFYGQVCAPDDFQ